MIFAREKGEDFNFRKEVLLENIREKPEINRNSKAEQIAFFLGIKQKHSKCALFRFYFTLTYLDAIKSKQVPTQGKYGKIWGCASKDRTINYYFQ